jgi:hypothetical protein
MWPIEAPTEIIRTPAAGPEPANTLVFLRCLIPWVPNDPQAGNTWRGPFDFWTQFRLDGYLQRDYDWHLANMVVSATGEIQHLASSTDLQFGAGVESIAPRLNQTDGVLGFSCGLFGKVDDDAIFTQGYISFAVTISAWVLCYEPRAAAPPPTGGQRTPWAAALPEGPRLVEYIRRQSPAFAAVARPARSEPRRDPCERD